VRNALVCNAPVWRSGVCPCGKRELMVNRNGGKLKQGSALWPPWTASIWQIYLCHLEGSLTHAQRVLLLMLIVPSEALWQFVAMKGADMLARCSTDQHGSMAGRLQQGLARVWGKAPSVRAQSSSACERCSSPLSGGVMPDLSVPSPLICL